MFYAHNIEQDGRDRYNYKQFLKRKKYKFYGSVQGVGFRYTARNAANMYRLTGYVRNEYDGSVTCEVQGEQLTLFHGIFPTIWSGSASE